jgi:Putative F0F1-ATPase subunit Ca2+/Mg2+ transporter
MVDEPQEPLRHRRAAGEQSPWALASLGTQFFVALLAFGYAGNWVDERLSTSPLFLLAGVLGGGGGAFYLSYRRLMSRTDADAQRRDDSSDTSPRP